MSKVETRERISTLSTVLRDRRMAMGNTSRRDRLLGVNDSFESSSEIGEFKEEDIWGIDINVGNPPDKAVAALPRSNVGFGSVVQKFDTGPRKWIPRDTGLGLSGLSRTSVGVGRVTSASKMIPQIENGRKVVSSPTQHQSAPVNVPDWSRVLKHSKKVRSPRVEDELGEDEEGEEDEDDDEKLPPHEMVARSQTERFSVFEGAGRTLKGRDLSRVRNAVLKQTGFL